jgi:hemolysin activation/secretion protein
MIVPVAFALALALDAGATPADLPEVREIELHGVEAFSREEVLGFIRLNPGDPLRREPAAIAAGLQRRYRLSGYPGARAEGTFDDGAGRLALDVEEGHLLEVSIEGLDEPARARALSALGLETGRVLREGDIWAAIARLDDASEGAVKAVGSPLWSVEPLPGGTRLVLPLTKSPAHFDLGLWSPRVQGRHNRVDGVSVGLRSETSLTNSSSYNHLRLRAAGSYAFDSKDARYSLGIHRPFGSGGRFGLGYEYHNLSDSEDLFREYGLEEVQGDTYNSEKATDLFRRIGHQAYLFGRIDARTQAGVSFRSDGYTSLQERSSADEPNPPIEEGRMRSIIATVRFASRGDFFRIPRVERDSFLFPSLYLSPALKPERLRAEATYEISRPGLGSDFDFSRLIGRLRFHKPVTDRYRLDAVAYAGYTEGAPPLPKRFFLGGLGTLRGFDKKQLTGKDMFMASVEWSWLPPSRFVPAAIPFYDGGALWGGSAPATGWRHDVGLGLRWPQVSRVFGRLDAAVALNPEAGQSHDVHWNLRLQIPF